MKLLTKVIEKKLPALYSTEDIPMEDKKFICKFFTPDSNFTWYVLEGNQEGENFMFYGLVDGLNKEWGNFSLNELMSVRGSLGLPIERDLHFENVKVSDIV